MIKSFSAILIPALLTTSCLSTADLERQVTNLQQQNYSQNSALRAEINSLHIESINNQQEILKQAKRAECILRETDAKLSCEILLSGQANSLLLQRQILQCMTNKGFGNGLAICE